MGHVDDAALRRVATLVARQERTDIVFEAVVNELVEVLGVGSGAGIYQDDPNAAPAALAFAGEPIHLDARRGRSSQADDQEHGGRHRPNIKCPIIVQDHHWGALIVDWPSDALRQDDIEQRVSPFAELAAIAIANEEARDYAQRLVKEQAALRRVATLVAGGAASDKVMDAVVAEVAELLGAAQVGLARYEGERDISVVAMRGQDPSTVRPGTRLPMKGDNLSLRVLRSGRPGRFDHRKTGHGPLNEVVRDNDISVTVGAPVYVDGELWGMIGASWKGANVPPTDAEERLAQFAELVATAIANADSRAKLTASRARFVAAGDEARRRVVRDLHDGAQQRLVHAIIALKLAQRAIEKDDENLRALLAEALSHAEQGNAALRELAHGILPSVLTRGGLRAAVDSIVSKLDVSVDVTVPSTRLSPEIESSAYFVVAEALTNVVKHSLATSVKVLTDIEDNALRLEVRDDGIGGADANGSGLTGISDRVAALGGTLTIESPRAGGTRLIVELPLST
jgi:signal transduction histidine kinase